MDGCDRDTGQPSMAADGDKGGEGSHTRLLTETKEQPRAAADGDKRAAEGGPFNGA